MKFTGDLLHLVQEKRTERAICCSLAVAGVPTSVPTVMSSTVDQYSECLVLITWRDASRDCCIAPMVVKLLHNRRTNINDIILQSTKRSFRSPLIDARRVAGLSGLRMRAEAFPGAVQYFSRRSSIAHTHRKRSCCCCYWLLIKTCSACRWTLQCADRFDA